MTFERDPVRLVDDEGEPPALRAILRAGRADLPADDVVARIAAAVTKRILGGGSGPPGGSGGGGPGSVGGSAVVSTVQSGVPVSGPVTAGPVSAGVIAAGLVAATGAVALGVAFFATPASSPARVLAVADAAVPIEAPLDASSPISAAARDPRAEPEPSPPARSPRVRVEPSPSEVEVAGPAPRTPAMADEPSPSPPDEFTLVSGAQRFLGSAPREALALAERAAALYPDGALAQEREMVAISALVDLGRMPEARARAARFRERWPRSSHVRRLDVLAPP